MPEVSRRSGETRPRRLARLPWGRPSVLHRSCIFLFRSGSSSATWSQPAALRPSPPYTLLDAVSESGRSFRSWPQPALLTLSGPSMAKFSRRYARRVTRSLTLLFTLKISLMPKSPYLRSPDSLVSVVPYAASDFGERR